MSITGVIFDLFADFGHFTPYDYNLTIKYLCFLALTGVGQDLQGCNRGGF